MSLNHDLTSGQFDLILQIGHSSFSVPSRMTIRRPCNAQDLFLQMAYMRLDTHWQEYKQYDKQREDQGLGDRAWAASSQPQNVEYVVKFPYLGSYRPYATDSEPDVCVSIGQQHHFCNGSVLYGHQTPPTWFYTAIMIRVWDVEENDHYRTHARRLPSRTILGTSWRDHATNEELVRRAARCSDSSNIVLLQGEWNGWSHRPTADRKIRPRSNALDRAYREAAEERGGGRIRHDGTHYKEMGVSWQMKTSLRPIFRKEQVEQSISK